MKPHSPPAGEHGNRCSCRALAEALGMSPKVIGFRYCDAVLKKRWLMECNHGGCAEPPAHDTAGMWHDVGEIDPVKAILIKNE